MGASFDNLFICDALVYSYEDDSFLCNTCTFRGVTPPVFDKTAQHVHTHPIVHCKPRVKDPTEETAPTADERIRALEERLGRMEKGMTEMEKSIGQQFVNVDQRLATIQSAVQELLAARSISHSGNGTAHHV